LNSKVMEDRMPSTIRLGDTGEDVKRLQRVFVRMKVLSPGDLDGSFGPKTELAVKDFQQSNGLTADGVVGPVTWNHLNPYREASPQLKAGSLGPVVAMLQRVLRTGFDYTGAIDGIYGPGTEAVVRQYQTDSGLPATGIMDEQTWMAPAGAAGATLESLSGLVF
jgi:peptidoglycan hydrolase-like protein with peptidoglycan-binding domain